MGLPLRCMVRLRKYGQATLVVAGAHSSHCTSAHKLSAKPTRHMTNGMEAYASNSIARCRLPPPHPCATATA